MIILSQQIMSGNEEGDEDQELLVKTKPKTKKPPLYKVLLINDDYTPMEFVVMILERFFGLTHAQAFDIMITVHKKGLAVVDVFSYEVAETKLVKLDNGSYRSFVLLEYPIAQVYKAFINRVEENDNLKSTVTALKNTDVFKELEQYVAEFSGA